MIKTGEMLMDSETGKLTAVEKPSSEPLQGPGVNMNFQIPPAVFDEFSRGNPGPLIEIVKCACPKQNVPRVFESWKSVKKRTNKVSIVGFADSRDEAPYNDQTWEIWGLNSLFEAIPRWDRWFEVHERKLFAWDTNKEIGYGLTREGKPYMEALANLKNMDGHPTPCYMVEAYADIPNAIRYPLEDMITAFDPQRRLKEWKNPFKGSYDLDWNGYLTNSISYMIALAIHEGYEEIGIYGVDMATVAEYASQRASCEYYVGIAVGKGIKVTIPDTADLLKTRMIYGFEAEATNVWRNKMNKIKKSMNDRYNMANQNLSIAQKQIDQYIGAIECVKELDKIWGECHMKSAEGTTSKTS